MPVIMSKIKPSACRRLQFDDEDDDNDNNGHVDEGTADQNFANACLEELRLREREEQSRRWNFDFVTETPLPGPYEWIQVTSEDDLTLNTSQNTLVEAHVTTVETQQNHQNDLTEAMDCDVNVAVTTTTQESSTKSDTLEQEQMMTPTKSSQ